MSETFRALVLEEADKKVSASIQELDIAQLPEGDVTVDVAYSTLNYKDGMVLNGIGRLVRTYPHVPGVDFSGTVSASDSPDYKVGDKVILTGWRVGEAHWGGYAEKARVKSDWLVPLPDGLTEKQAMALGTAGFTAMLAIMELQDHGIGPDAGPVLVTGANGGVGGVALALLAAGGYEVHASTGRAELADHLKSLGASEIIPREELDVEPERPLSSERWAGVVDAVGGNTLASILPQMKYRGAVAACGLAGGAQLNSTVIPFLLRGVKLLGIDSVMCPKDLRVKAWARLATELPSAALDALTHEVPLSALPEQANKILKGETQGRIVVDISA
ncbi:MAG: oxidoreductase [Rhodospirillaceae bacterium]|jgi:acrylyl-CoA reductase (NADPH)|nr:oxidoreductase [Rhodospirillaceae bacterium]MBT5457134.1 oxidoreductase [Rhodospirillaceae bacterium]